MSERRETSRARSEAGTPSGIRWVLATPLLGGLVGAIAGIVVTAVAWSDAERHGGTFGDGRLISGAWWQAVQDAALDWWVGTCAIAALVIALTLVAWRVLAWGLIGLAVCSVLGGLVGGAIGDDAGAPMDWGGLYGFGIGAVVGTILGLVWGGVVHVSHRRRIAAS